MPTYTFNGVTFNFSTIGLNGVDYAFIGATNFNDGNGTTLGINATMNVTTNETFTIPDTVTSLGNSYTVIGIFKNAFRGCIP